MKKVISFIMVNILLLLCCVPIQYASAEEQSISKWETYSDSENVLFFPDMTVKHPDYFEQNNTPYSLSIKSESTQGYAEYRRDYIVEENTDYVINVFVKSSFVTPTQDREGFNDKSIMPVCVTVVIDDTVIESKISIGRINEWQEISVGFTTASTNSVQIQLSAEFTQPGQVWFDNIRIDQPRKMNVLMLAYDSINATYDNYTYQTTRNSAITNTVITNTMSMFDNIIKELTNSKIITNTTTVFPGTLSSIQINSSNKVYASYIDIENDIPNSSEPYDFIFVLMPWNAGTFINGKDPFMGTCFAYEKIANVDQGLVAENIMSDYNAPLDGLVHEFTHYIDFLSGCTMDTDIPFIDNFEKHNIYQSPNSNALVIDGVEYLSYYDYYYSGINSTANKNYVEKIDIETPPIYQHFNVKYQWYYDFYNGHVLHYDSGFWGHSSQNIVDSNSISDYVMETSMITSGIYRLKNVYYTYYPYLKEQSGSLTIVSENNTINEYWDIWCVNGYYEIAPLSNPSLRLTVDELSVSNQPDQGTVKLVSANDSDDQKWIILPTDAGYKIISKRDQTKCFEYGYGTLDNKAQLWKYVASPNQNWEIESVQTLSDGVYNIKNNYYQSYINYDGNEVNFISDPSTLLDNWSFESIGGYYKIRPTISVCTPLSVDELYLSVNPAQGSVCFVENSYEIHQLWIVVQLPNGAYRITSAVDPNKCFEFSYGNVYNEVQLWEYVEGSNQTWSLESDSMALELSIENYYYKDLGYGFISSDLSASSNETTWYFKPYDGHYIIYNEQNRRMAISNSTNGSAVILADGSDINTQELWDVTILEGNLFKISPVSLPDKCLEYSYGTGNVILQTWTQVDAQNQTWILS